MTHVAVFVTSISKRGLNSHLARPRCGKEEEFYNWKVADEPGENPQCVVTPEGWEWQETKSPMNWQKMNEEPSWKKLDDVVSAQLSNHGDARKRINVLENVIYEEAVNLFGDKEKETKGPWMPSSFKKAKRTR